MNIQIQKETPGEALIKRYIEHCSRKDKDPDFKTISIPEYKMTVSPQCQGEYIMRINGHLYFMETRKHIKDDLIYDFENAVRMIKELKKQWIDDQYAPEAFLCSLMASSLIGYYDRDKLDQLLEDLSGIDPIYSIHIEEQKEHFTNNRPLGYKKN